jgi:hypothetical protein
MSDADTHSTHDKGKELRKRLARPAETSVTGRPIADYADRVPRYKQLRQVGFNLNKVITKSLTREIIDAAAAKLNMLEQGTIVFETEDEAALLADYCFHDVWRDGRNLLQTFLAESPPPAESDEMKMLRAAIDARYSVFLVTDVAPGVGIQLEDVLYGGRYPVIDVNLGNTAEAGVPMAMRMMTVEDLWMSTGTGIPLDGEIVERIGKGLDKMLPGGQRLETLTPERRSDVTAMMIRVCRARHALSRVAYADPGDTSAADRVVPPAWSRSGDRRYYAPPKIGRNDPCPCGSGRKYKKCCGHGRF